MKKLVLLALIALIVMSIILPSSLTNANSMEDFELEESVISSDNVLRQYFSGQTAAITHSDFGFVSFLFGIELVEQYSTTPSYYVPDRRHFFVNVVTNVPFQYNWTTTNRYYSRDTSGNLYQGYTVGNFDWHRQAYFDHCVPGYCEYITDPSDETFKGALSNYSAYLFRNQAYVISTNGPYTSNDRFRYPTEIRLNW